ncbi:hypothetical protein DOE73_26320 [Paenibacillus dendritiformis]|nr:hypothetical protein DOE73_26320 [Paenibacillus dendritiformis]
MRLAVRIAYSEDLHAQRCLAAAGGRIVFPKGKPAQFAFGSNEQYDEYRRMLRMGKAAQK